MFSCTRAEIYGKNHDTVAETLWGAGAKMKRAALQVIILGLTASLILQVSLSNTIPVHAATGTSFYFAAAGDIGSVTSGNGLATLNNLSASGTSFLLALGDLSYSRA